MTTMEVVGDKLITVFVPSRNFKMDIVLIQLI